MSLTSKNLFHLSMGVDNSYDSSKKGKTSWISKENKTVN